MRSKVIAAVLVTLAVCSGAKAADETAEIERIKLIGFKLCVYGNQYYGLGSQFCIGPKVALVCIHPSKQSDVYDVMGNNAHWQRIAEDKLCEKAKLIDIQTFK